MSDYTRLPHDIADCMSRAGSPLSDDQKLLLAGYLAPVQQQLEQAQAKVAELESQIGLLAERFRELEQNGGALHPLREAFGSSGNAWLLRKQAEAVEDMWDKVNPDNPGRSLRDEAQRLRQQADDIEKEDSGDD